MRVESDHHKIWRLFCANFGLFRGTPSAIWLAQELSQVFGIQEKLKAENADRPYDILGGILVSPEFTPCALFKRVKIEVLATTDAATGSLEHHHAIRASDWDGRIILTFRLDGVFLIRNCMSCERYYCRHEKE